MWGIYYIELKKEKVMTIKKSPGYPNWISMFKGLVQLLAFAFVVNILWHVTTTKFNTMRELNASYGESSITAADRTKQLECLTSNIYHEAGNEPFEGKVAVAQVTLNRVESGKFGNGVCGVIYQKNIVYEKVICQFSWACMSVAREKPLHTAAFKESEEVAKKVLMENFRLPSLKYAMYYHADYVNPNWGLPKITQIGHHIFYTEKGNKS
jgi:spore germination cell wall hydrolase CwlJ-like protein